MDDPSLSSLMLGGVSAEALICFIVSLPCVAFFAVGNRILTNFGVVRARRMLEDGKKVFEPFVENADRFFMTLNLLEMVSVIVMIAFGHEVLSTWIKASWVVWIILAVCFLTFDLLFVRFFGLADEHSLAGRYVRILRPLALILRPLTFILTLLVKPFTKPDEERFADADRIEEELELMVDESTRHGGLQSMQGKIISSAIDFGETTVREVMIPRTDLTMCEVKTKLDDALKLCVQEGYSRLPVYEDDVDTIVGILYYKDLMKRVYELENDPQKRQIETIRPLVREVNFVPETKHLQSLFNEFQREHYHIAVVIDEFGGTAGIVTLEDILEEFFGEIQDEYDFEENPIVPMDGDGNQVQVDAKTNVSEIADFFDVEIEENADFDTVGGLVSFELGRVGAVGDEVTVAGLRFTVLEANEKCILKLQIVRVIEETVSDEDNH
ncbi:MAG: HlyC/CorC family transporter [Proteobacteria bacterium]|nr:HlyC/CorC family transporter [Pseudomonadota bacterium]